MVVKVSPNGEKRTGPKLDTGERGRSGLIEFSGIVSETEIRALASPVIRRRIYKEMRYDPTISAILFAIEMLIRRVTWTVQPASEDPKALEAADHVESCLDDMSHSFEDFISEVLTFLPEGFAYHELVYKLRNGENAKPGEASRYSDGRVGWRKLPGRSADTLYKWEFDEGGGIQAFVQQAPPTYGIVPIPIEKGLLFRTSVAKGNPEGVSILRSSYSSWFAKKRIQTYEAIGIERDLAGLPILYVPAEWVSASAATDLKTAYAEAKEIVTNLRRDEQEGVVLPMILDKDGHQLLDLKLLSTGGRRNFDTGGIVARYDQRIAMTVLADFMLLGSQKVGSFALASSKTELFATALGAWLQMIASVMNRHAIPRLVALNGWPGEVSPKLIPGDIESPDLAELGEYISKLAGVGISLSDAETENFLRGAGSLPLKPEDEEEEIEEEPEVLEATKALRERIEKVLGS